MNVVSKRVILFAKFSLWTCIFIQNCFVFKEFKTLTLLSLVVFHHCGDCSDGLVFGRRSSNSLMNS